jgi:hypothetical protein
LLLQRYVRQHRHSPTNTIIIIAIGNGTITITSRSATERWRLEPYTAIHTGRRSGLRVAGCGLRVAGCCEIAQLANSYYDNRDKRRKKTYTFWASVTLRYAQANSGGQA